MNSSTTETTPETTDGTPPAAAPAAAPLASAPPTLQERYKAVMVPNYAPGLTFVRGKGSWLWDADGKKVLDFVSGIAVNALGHAHPVVLRAMQRQAARLGHVSNLYYSEPQVTLAESLVRHGLNGKVLFCNSGAEANEGLIKLARLWGSTRGGRHEIISFHKSFHGRTLATLTATGQSKVQEGFGPLPEGFVWADYNQIDSVKAAITEKTVAILIEPIQAEGGVLPAEPSFLKELQALCQERNILLLFDEVQTGIGRTGKWFAWQHSGVTPDAASIAKGLGGGFPIGAVLTGPELADIFQPGSHGTTFGGNPLGCAVAQAVIETIEKKNLLANVVERGATLKAGLLKLKAKYPFITDVRGEGLLIGFELNQPAKELEQILTRKGLITVATAGNVIRMLPPLNIKASEVRFALACLRKALKEFNVYATENTPS